MRVAFDVEQAGCESCGTLIGTALAEIGTVERLDVDESSDTAAVVLAGSATHEIVDAALERASAGAGHTYRVRPGSWRALA